MQELPEKMSFQPVTLILPYTSLVPNFLYQFDHAKSTVDFYDRKYNMLDQFKDSDAEHVLSLFQDAEEDLKADRQVVWRAISLNVACIEFAHEKFHSDREIMKHVIQNDPYQMHLIGEELKHDREIILLACKQNSHCLQYADAETRNDKDFVMNIIQLNSDKWLHYGVCVRWVKIWQGGGHDCN